MSPRLEQPWSGGWAAYNEMLMSLTTLKLMRNSKDTKAMAVMNLHNSSWVAIIACGSRFLLRLMVRLLSFFGYPYVLLLISPSLFSVSRQHTAGARHYLYISCTIHLVLYHGRLSSSASWLYIAMKSLRSNVGYQNRCAH
jgi:hypothetical protein